MKRRAYFVLPDVALAEQIVKELLLARVEARHIHVIARPDIDLGDLPDANVLQTTDLVHGAQLGVALGAGLGTMVGAVLMVYPIEGAALQSGNMLIGAIIGALFGLWTASLAGAGMSNSRLAPFRARIESGDLLLLVDVPYRRLGEITDMVARRHPDAVAGGVEPTIPAFP
jgi:hypothetical protein